MSNSSGKPAMAPGVDKILRLAIEKNKGDAEHLCVNHWLLALCERNGPMLEDACVGNIEAKSLKTELVDALQNNVSGKALDENTILTAAFEHAKARGKDKVYERDMAITALQVAGYEVKDQKVENDLKRKVDSAETKGTSRKTDIRKSDYEPVAAKSTPTLDKFGTDLTKEALEKGFLPIIGRGEETQAVIETLCRSEKRNAALVGPAGIGKTAIAEDLASRIVAGKVPDLLSNYRVISLQLSNVLAGSNGYMDFLDRVKKMIKEARQEGIILFLDEMHTMVGETNRLGTDEIGDFLKPLLARGDLVCIGATTDDEYRKFIESDKALERRFQPIRIQELSKESTFQILCAARDRQMDECGISASDNVLKWLLDCADDFLPNRYFPDKAIDLFNQCISYATIHNETEVSVEAAKEIAGRLVGIPIDRDDRLINLRRELTEYALLNTKDVELAINRLSVTEKSLDFRPSRPNLVILLVGEAARSKFELCEALARVLFGASENRIFDVDMGRYTSPYDISNLIGSSRGYVGYDDTLPLHAVSQTPWSVVLMDNVHACHPVIREWMTQLISDGYFSDTSGKRIHISEAIVVLTAQTESDELCGATKKVSLGFTSEREVASDASEGRKELMADLEEMLGGNLLSYCDIICSRITESDSSRRKWLERNLLKTLSERYQQHGASVLWDGSILDWLCEKQESVNSPMEWERIVDNQISPVIVANLPKDGSEVILRISKNTSEGIEVVMVEGEKASSEGDFAADNKEGGKDYGI